MRNVYLVLDPLLVRTPPPPVMLLILVMLLVLLLMAPISPGACSTEKTAIPSIPEAT